MSILRSAWLRSSSVSATGSAVSSASVASNPRALMVDGPLLPVSSRPSTGRRTSYSTSAPGRQVRVLVSGDPAEHAPGEQQPDHGHEVGAVAPAVQGQREPGSRQAGFGGGGEHVVGEAAERGLRVGAGKRGQGQTESDVPAAAERLPVVSASGMGSVGSQRGGLEQPGRLRVCGQPPAGLPAQPAAERRQVPPDQYERLGVLGGDKQRLGEQGAEGGLACACSSAGITAPGP